MESRLTALAILGAALLSPAAIRPAPPRQPYRTEAMCR